MGFFDDLKAAAQEMKTTAQEASQMLVAEVVVKVEEIERDTRDIRAGIKGAAQEAFEKGARKLDEVGKKVAELLDETPKPVEAAKKTKPARKPKAAKAAKTSCPMKKNL